MSGKFRINDLINNDAIAIKTKIFENSDALFDKISEVGVIAHKPLNKETLNPIKSTILQRSLRERVAQYPIGTGGGILLPLGNVPELDRYIGVFIKLTARQTFKEIPDGMPVDLIFSLFGPQDEFRTDLRLLVYIAHIFSNHAIRDELREAINTDEIYHILADSNMPTSSVPKI